MFLVIQRARVPPQVPYKQGSPNLEQVLRDISLHAIFSEIHFSL